MNDEIWKVIPDYPDYSVSSWGRITRTGTGGRYRPAGKMLGTINKLNGYVMLSLYRDGVQRVTGAHVVVCEVFHGPRPTAEHQVAHGDGCKTNNHPDNLRWATRHENMADAIAHGSMPRGDIHHARTNPERLARGERNGGGKKLTEAQVREILADTRIHKEIAADYGVVKSMIGMIKSRKVWTHVTDGALA